MKRSVAVAISLVVFAGVTTASAFADPPRVLRSEIRDRADGGHGRSDRSDGQAWDRHGGHDNRVGGESDRSTYVDRDRQQVAVRDLRDDDQDRIRDRGQERGRDRDHNQDRDRDYGQDRDRHADHRGDHDDYRDRARDRDRDRDRGRERDRHSDRDRYRVGVYLGSPWTWSAYDRGYGYDSYAYDRGAYRDDCRVVYRWRYNRWGRRYSEPVQVCYDSWGRSYVSPYSDRW